MDCRSAAQCLHSLEYDGLNCSPVLHGPSFAGEEVDFHPLLLRLEDFADGASLHIKLGGNVFLPGLRMILSIDADELPVHICEFCLGLLSRTSAIVGA